MINSVKLFNLEISTRSMSDTIHSIKNRTKIKKGTVVFCCTLNEARMYSEDNQVKRIIDSANLRTPDGMPLVWGMRFKIGHGKRVYGPDLMENIFLQDKDKQLRHFFLGSTTENLTKIREKLINEYEYKSKNLGLHSPKFKSKLNQRDYSQLQKIIKQFNPDIVWVGMGSRKQLVVANQLSKRVQGVTWITVGAAFDFFAKTKRQAPKFIRNLGAEWLFRWIMEPRRLTRRYYNILQFLGKYIISK